MDELQSVTTNEKSLFTGECLHWLYKIVFKRKEYIFLCLHPLFCEQNTFSVYVLFFALDENISFHLDFALFLFFDSSYFMCFPVYLKTKVDDGRELRLSLLEREE